MHCCCASNLNTLPHNKEGVLCLLLIGQKYHFSVQFYGCTPFAINTTCCKDNTIDATDPTMYRHVSVDTDKNLVFLCDRKAYLVSSLFCRQPITKGIT